MLTHFLNPPQSTGGAHTTPVDSENPLPVKLNASVALTGDFEIGGVYLQDSSGNKVAVSGNSLKIDGSSVTQPVSMVNIPLATGAATSSKQDDQTAALTAISGYTNSANTHLAAIDTKLAGSVAVTGAFFQATQPVSGTFWQATQPVSIAAMPSTPVTGVFYQATQPISALTLPLPSNAAQESGGNLATIAAQAVDPTTEELLAKIVNVLSFISYQLAELPANLTLSLNKGVPALNADSYENYFSSLN